MFSDVLLTVDFDRTLTAPDSTIPERNIQAIRYFMENGGAFTVNTGRSLPMTRYFREKVPVNAPLLLNNGSLSYDLRTGEAEEVLIQLDQAETIRRCMELLPDMVVEVQGMDAHYIFEENPIWDDFSQSNNCACGHAQPESDLGGFMKFTLYYDLRSNRLADLYTLTPRQAARMDEAETLLKREFGVCCEVFRAAPRIIDVHAKGVSKGNSARALQKKLGRKILVCVGDGENDVSMLREADFAFSPADGSVADRFENVCRCADGAVADVIYEKIPGILKNRP